MLGIHVCLKTMEAPWLVKTSLVESSVWSGSTPGGYSGFQVTGMIEWSQKSRPKKLPGPKINPQKINCITCVMQSGTIVPVNY